MSLLNSAQTGEDVVGPKSKVEVGAATSAAAEKLHEGSAQPEQKLERVATKQVVGITTVLAEAPTNASAWRESKDAFAPVGIAVIKMATISLRAIYQQNASRYEI